MPTRFNLLSVVTFITRLVPSSGEFTNVLLTSRFNDGGVVDGILQMGMKGPDVWYKWDIRVRADFIEEVCPTECGTVKEHGLGWSLRSFWDLLVYSGTDEQCPAQEGVYDPTYACGPDSRFDLRPESADLVPTEKGLAPTDCDELRTDYLVGEYKCNALVDPLSCMIGDLSGKFGKLAPAEEKKGVFYTFKGETGMDPFPPSYLNYCDGEDCVDAEGVPPGNKFGSVQISCPCGEQLVCAKLNVEKIIKDDKYGKQAKDAYVDKTSYGDLDNSYSSKAYAATGKASYADNGKAYMGADAGYADTYNAYPETGKAYIDTGKAYVDTGKGYADTYGDEKVYADTGKFNTKNAYVDTVKAYIDTGKANGKGKAYAEDNVYTGTGKGYADTGKGKGYADTGSKGYADTGSKAYLETGKGNGKAYVDKGYGGYVEEGYEQKYELPSQYVGGYEEQQVKYAVGNANAKYENRYSGNNAMNAKHGHKRARHGGEYRQHVDEYKTSARRSPSNSNYNSNLHSQTHGNTGRDYTDTYYVEENTY